MRSDSHAQIEALEAEDRLSARLLEDGETFEDSDERIESLRRHIAEIDRISEDGTYTERGVGDGVKSPAP